MTKTEHIKEVLEDMGYNPEIDKEGDLFIRYQLKHIYFLVNEEEDDNFVVVALPQFYSFDPDEDMLYLAACNSTTRQTKMAKIFIDETYNHVSAGCEFYFTDDDSLRMNIERSLKIISVMRSNFRNTILQLKED